MAKKRRSDKHHDIGDPKPGTVGDKRPTRDKGNTPMERIHNRRHGELSIPEPSDNHSKNQDNQDDDEKDEKKYTGKYAEEHNRVENIPGINNDSD